MASSGAIIELLHGDYTSFLSWSLTVAVFEVVTGNLYVSPTGPAGPVGSAANTESMVLRRQRSNNWKHWPYRSSGPCQRAGWSPDASCRTHRNGRLRGLCWNNRQRRANRISWIDWTNWFCCEYRSNRTYRWFWLANILSGKNWPNIGPGLNVINPGTTTAGIVGSKLFSPIYIQTPITISGIGVSVDGGSYRYYLGSWTL